MSAAAFTLVELLTVLSIIVVLAAILFPVFAQAREKARQAACESNLKQIGTALALYLQDNDGTLPDRRDLKLSLPGGFKPWGTWPTSDPRSGWAVLVLDPYIKNSAVWTCPSVEGDFGDAIQVKQSTGTDPEAPVARYWMWRFDQPIYPKPGPNGPTFWGRTEQEAVDDLRASGNTTIDPLVPQGPADVEMVVDPYFPRTVPNPPADLAGKAVHMGGRNRVFLDGHVKWRRDIRTG